MSGAPPPPKKARTVDASASKEGANAAGSKGLATDANRGTIKIYFIGTSQAGEPSDWEPIDGYEIRFEPTPWGGFTTEKVYSQAEKTLKGDDLAGFDRIWIFVGSNDPGPGADEKNSKKLLELIAKKRGEVGNRGATIWLIHNIFGAAGNAERKFCFERFDFDSVDNYHCLTPELAETKHEARYKAREAKRLGVGDARREEDRWGIIRKYRLEPNHHVDDSRHLTRAGIKYLIELTERYGGANQNEEDRVGRQREP